MNSIQYTFDYSLVPDDQILKNRASLEPVVKMISSMEVCQIPFNLDIDTLSTLIEQKKKHNPAMMIVVGIGGSNLGAQAIYEALYGKEGNLHFPLFFADTVDSDHIYALLHRAEHALKNKRTILVCVISKSGTTTETIANFECFLELLKKYHPNNYHELVIAITDKNSKLWDLALKNKFECLSIPKEVGGRYSVFTAVGLIPLLFSQVDIKEFIHGAQSADINAAVTSACILAYHYELGKNIHDLFIFDSSLETLGKWYRQLMGESIGKDGKGITPIVSIGSTDLHSMGQLYLGGPQDKTATFIFVDHVKHDVKIPQLEDFNTLVPHLQGRSLVSIMKAIFKGTQKAYAENKFPFITIELPKKSAFYIGQLLQTKMIEMIMLAHLLDVNPFDQPQVELYKTQTRKILANE